MELASHLQAVEDLFDSTKEGVVFFSKIRNLGPYLFGEIDKFVGIMFLYIWIPLVELG